MYRTGDGLTLIYNVNRRHGDGYGNCHGIDTGYGYGSGANHV